MKYAYALLCACAFATAANAGIKPGYEFKKPGLTAIPGDVSLAESRLPAEFGAGTVGVRMGFEGISQYDGASLGRNFIPSDGVAAAGTSQVMQTTNGGIAVFDKATGARTLLQSDAAWWQARGQAGSSGDQRIMFNKNQNRWVVLGFGANAKDIQIAVSDTDDALGAWKVTQFEGFSNGFFQPIADYPTIAMDRNALYIGTNDFGAATNGGTRSFRGTTLNIIPLNDVFSAGGPTAANNKKFVTPYSASATDFTRGFAIQGVNSDEASTTGNILAVSLEAYAVERYDILNAGTAGAVRTATTRMGSAYDSNSPGRQPAAIAANRRVVDTGDDRIGAAVYEHDGKIYGVHTVTPEGEDRTVVRVYVIDQATNEVLFEKNIGAEGYDYYQGSIAVNALGQVVIGYNRSGTTSPDGRITLAALMFNTTKTGKLYQRGEEMVLKVSLTDDYHNGSIFGQAAVGRQRWQDYSSVALDPNDVKSFWVEGGFAREYNNAAGGHVGGTGGSRWSTWIAQIGVGSVPEPGTWALMIVGFGAVGLTARRKRALEAAA